MNWKLVHEDVAINTDSSVVSRTHMILEKDGVQIHLGVLDKQEEHALGAKRVLVDTANMLRRLAHEMENKADKLY
jgi:hypothetical protein